MVPDLIFVAEAFRRFNAEIFRSSLPVPRFALTRARRFQGKLVYRRERTLSGMRCHDFEMRIRTEFNLATEEWEDVVIHEMIHLYVAVEGLADSGPHGHVFRSLMTEINGRHGRKVTVSGHATDEQRDTGHRVTGHFVCLTRFSDGRLGLATVAKTRLFELWDSLGRFPGVVAMRWVGTSDPWFSRYPKALKARLYIVAEEEVTPHLKGAVLFERTGNAIKCVSRRCSPDELLP